MTSTLSRPTAPDTPAPPSRGRALERASVAALLIGTGVLYLVNLAASGWANAFYSAAAQAGGENWEAWFFGSSDAANSITVDKTPAALWVTGLAVRVFGLSSWSILVPQALMGIGAVALLYTTVRRTSGHAAGLLAGAVLALTPVATLIFRFNNPDALLVLLLVAAVWATLRGLEHGRGRWLLLAGVFLGLGFLTKMLQAWLIVPVLAAVWLVAAPTGIGRRVRDVLLAGLAMVVSAGWWVLVVELWPAGSRPYIGGSQHDSVLELVWGYNGLGRLTGDETGSVGGGAGGGWGQTGLTRLFGSEMGSEASWLLPTALILLATLVWLTWRRPRTDRLRAAVLAWGGWLLVTGLLFSYMAGIIHPYYTVALAPAIAALVGIGAVELWRVRDRAAPRVLLAASVAAAAVWGAVLLGSWQPWLSWTSLALGLAAACALLGVHRLPRLLTAGVVTVAVLASLAGSAAWSIATAAEPHTGAIPSAGAASAARAGFGGPGGPGGFGGFGGRPGGALRGGGLGGGPGGLPGGPARGGGRAPGGGFAGLLGTTTPSAQVTALLEENAADYTWVAAAVGSNTAAGYQLATGSPVMAVGGFNGTDPSPTLAQFQQDVSRGEIHWFVGGAIMGGTATGGSDAAARIAEWVQQNFAATTVDGVTLYDLSGGTTA
ncbi:glycosyltransferase family 39 protein [Pseudonocardia oroxyli]|uniref:4-amino-4-deoxy-L-arabinose transferase n=1 Tax=Pseudonocardia oroxyli TaxID=366584 RepID=A0A1G7MTW0_PSEOR|nr:glycosyltransferase family 39 protein [Pseudonocardia oroxyli]SDF65086.1 4-amino-4-deoxy-L-arabinose transferase [Pseudonocardia oroxyli]